MADSPRHILYIAEFSTGGSIESLYTLISGLDKESYGATVLFYSMPESRIHERFEAAGATVLALYPRKAAERSPPQLQKHNLQSKVRSLLGHRVESIYYSFKFAVHFLRFRLPVYRAIRRQIGLIKPDLVHCNNGARTDTAGILAARSHGIPSVCHVRTFGKVSSLGVRLIRSNRRFLCISDAVRKQLIGYGVDAARCVVVPNAVDASRYNVSVSAVDIHTEFGWDSADKIFALIGRLVHWKGQDYFIQAIAEARKTDPSIRGLIVGSADGASEKDTYMNNLKALVRNAGVEDSVKFTGHRTDVPNIMRSADAVICPSSLPEPFGRVIIESMAVGTPAIATNAGGATDIIDDAVNGLMVPLKDGAALATAMLRISSDDALAHALRDAALQAVADHYLAERHVSQVCDIYQKEIGK